MKLGRPDPRAEMVEVARCIWERRLTDSAGGNLSVRANGRIFLTPRFMGSKYRWAIQKRQISIVDEASLRVVRGPRELSREAQMHFAIYRMLSQAGAIIHAHAPLLTAFASSGKELPMVLEHTRKFRSLPTVEAPAHSRELAEAVAHALAPLKDELDRHPLAVLIPYHGVVVVGKNLAEAYDALDRLEHNALIALALELLERRP